MPSFDFHIHSALSACAEDTMSPRQILSRAKEAGLRFIAISDHNASANVAPALLASSDFEGISLIPGIEVSSVEEAHFIALFQELTALDDFQKLVDSHLPPGENPEEIFGYQLIYDSEDEITGTDDRLRQVGTSLPVESIVSEVKARGGFVLPSHVFKNKFSIKSQLGILLPGLGFDAVEIGAKQWVSEKYQIGMRVEGYPAITGSDSHFLESVGRIFNRIEGDADNLKELFALLDSLSK